MKQRMQEFFRKGKRGSVARWGLVALIMAIILCINMIPVGLAAAAFPVNDAVIAADDAVYDDTANATIVSEETYDTAEAEPEETVEDVQILAESEVMRTETAKNYILSDGSYMMQDYGIAVHYKSGEEWKAIDNTLVDDGKSLRNKSNSFEVAFGKRTSQKGLISIKEGDIEIALDYTGSNRKSTSEAKKAVWAESLSSASGEAEMREYKEASAFRAKTDFFTDSAEVLKDVNLKNKFNDRLHKVSDAVVYENMAEGIDFEYIVEGRSLKENIIINAKQSSYVYTFSLSLKNASASLNDNSEVVIYDEDGEEKYLIPAGYMYDAAGERSYDVSYTLSSAKDGYVLTVSADAAWINDSERVFPVTVDPTIMPITSGYVTTIASTGGYISGNEFRTSAINCKILSIYYNAITFGLIKFTTDFNKFLVKAATLSVNTSNYVYRKYNAEGTSYTDLSNGRFSLNCHMLQGDWNTAGNVTGAKFLDTDNRNGDTTSNTNYVFDVTEYVLYASRGHNYGLRISPDAESTYSKGTNFTSPVLSVYYRDKKGMQPQHTYITQDMGESGMGYFDTFTGQVLFKNNILDFGSAALPIALTNTYDSNNDDNINSGRCWTLNLTQKLNRISSDDADIYLYTDQTGREILLSPQSRPNVTNGTRVISDSDGMGLELTMSGNNYILTDRARNKLTFDTSGYLREIADNFGHTLQITYGNSWKMTAITDSRGQTFSVYTSGGTIRDIAGLIDFNYPSIWNLSYVENWTTGKTTSFTYTNNGLLSTVTYDDKSVEYIYESTTNRCTSIIETNLGMETQTYTISYVGTRTTGVKSSLSNETVFYHHEEDGTLNSVYSVPAIASKPTPKIAQGNGVNFLPNDTHQNVGTTVMQENFVASNFATYYVKDKGSTQSSFVVNGSGTLATMSSTHSNKYNEAVLSAWVNLFIGTEAPEVYADVTFNDNSTERFDLHYEDVGLIWQFATVKIKTKTGDKSIKSMSIKTTANIGYIIDCIQVVGIPWTSSYTGDPDNRAVYDSFGRVTTQRVYNTITEQDEVINYTYDATYGDLKTVSHNGKTTTYTYSRNSGTGKIEYIVEAMTISGVSGYIQRVYHYNTDGSLTAYVDENGITTYYTYNYTTNTVTETINGVSTTYTYNADYSRMTGVSAGGATIGYTYAESYTGITAPNGNITKFNYDECGNVYSVVVDNQTLVSYGYTEEGSLETESYANGQTITNVYNANGTLASTKQGATTLASYTYDAWGNITGYTDNANSANITYKYYEKTNGSFTNEKITNKTGTGAYREEVKEDYDHFGRLDKLTEWNNVKGGSLVTSFYYNDNTGNLTRQTGPFGTYNYTYDANNRFKSATVDVPGGSGHYRSEVYYTANKNQINNIVNSRGGITLNNYTYSYDAAGRISSIGGSQTHSYQYDSQGRLVRENNAALGETYIFSYNNYQDLTASEGCYRYMSYKDVYNYTTGTPTVLRRTEYYLYYNNGWWDQLTSVHVYDGNGAYVGAKSYNYEYDDGGNLTSFSNNGTTKTLTWTRGNMLASYGNNTYNYGIDGLRTEKVVGGEKTQYFWHGNRLYAEKRGDTWIEYYYDSTGIRGMSYGGTKYVFVKSLLGDVTRIYNVSTGAHTTDYQYDAYGNVMVFNYDSANIGMINPFRYRGYYQDSVYTAAVSNAPDEYLDIGLYYLQSRYYDPTMMGFISPDNVFAMLMTSSIPGGGTNLYAYCLNNPVMFSDSSGQFPILITLILGGATILGGVVGGLIAHDNAVSAGKTGSDLNFAVLKGVLFGGSLGLAAGGLIVAGGAAIFGGMHGLSASFLGMTAIKSFAIGVLAFNQFAFITAPLAGIIMEGIELGGGSPTKVPKPQRTPTHPGSRRLSNLPIALGIGEAISYYVII